LFQENTFDVSFHIANVQPEGIMGMALLQYLLDLPVVVHTNSDWHSALQEVQQQGLLEKQPFLVLDTMI
jgi:hypothetical protein